MECSCAWRGPHLLCAFVVLTLYSCHLPQSANTFSSATEAINTLREGGSGGIVIDQYLEDFVITDDAGNAVGPINDGDSVAFFNFRGDRSIQLTKAFEFPEEKFPHF